MKEWVWLDPEALIAAHEEQLAEHGGAAGMRDRGLFESALARPQNLAVYGDPDVSKLAAAYGFGLAKNHAFIDGNKRVALVALESFLLLNGHQLVADDAQAVLVILSVAAGSFDQKELADWIMKNIEPL
jgi:death-on-curing protein